MTRSRLSLPRRVLRFVIVATVIVAGGSSCAGRAPESTIQSAPGSGLPDPRVVFEGAAYQVVTDCVERRMLDFHAESGQRSETLWSGRVTSYRAIPDAFHTSGGDPVLAYVDLMVSVRNLGSSVEVIALPSRVRVVAGTRFAPGPHGCTRTEFADVSPNGWETDLYLPRLRECVDEWSRPR